VQNEPRAGPYRSLNAGSAAVPCGSPRRGDRRLQPHRHHDGCRDATTALMSRIGRGIKKILHSRNPVRGGWRAGGSTRALLRRPWPHSSRIAWDADIFARLGERRRHHHIASEGTAKWRVFLCTPSSCVELSDVAARVLARRNKAHQGITALLPLPSQSRH
jgi:hypothetical protein